MYLDAGSFDPSIETQFTVGSEYAERPSQDPFEYTPEYLFNQIYPPENVNSLKIKTKYSNALVQIGKIFRIYRILRENRTDPFLEIPIEVQSLLEKFLVLPDYLAKKNGKTWDMQFMAADRFQVDGIEQDRIAVNTGQKIIFNMKILNQKSFSYAELTQIFLHELFHFYPNVDISIKDQWANNIANKIKQNERINISTHGEMIRSIFLPSITEVKKVPYDDLPYQDQYFDMLKDRLLVSIETNNFLKYSTEVYSAIVYKSEKEKKDQLYCLGFQFFNLLK